MIGLSLSAQDHASEAMEVFIELMEIEVSIIVPHVADIVRFCLEVGSEFCFSKRVSCSVFYFLLSKVNKSTNES